MKLNNMVYCFLLATFSKRLLSTRYTSQLALFWKGTKSKPIGIRFKKSSCAVKIM